MKKKILLLLPLCTLAVNSQLIQAETVSTPSSVITSSQNSAISGQLSVVEEDGQMKAVLSDVTGEITGVTAQFSSTQNTGYEISFHLDEHGRYVTMLDRSHFPPDDENFSLDALVQLKDGTSQQLTRYDFKWVKDAEEAFARPEEVESEYTKDSAISSRSIMSYETKAKQESTLSQEVSSNSARSVQAQSSNDTVTSVSPATPTGSISVSNIDANSGSFDVRITNVSAPRGLAKVLVPTWTEVNGQDDIIWYEASLQSDGSYLLRVNKSHHKYGAGKYNIHVYYQGQDGSMSFAGATTVDLPEVKLGGTISVSNIDANSGRFDVRITNASAPRGLAKVLVPTWTEVNGQDDIIWYEASLQSDGSYLLRVNKSRHKYGTGKYNIHVYYQGQDGSMSFAGATTVDLPEVKLSGSISVSNIDANSGSFDVRITNVSAPRGLAKVLVPTWTEVNGQDDILWYEALLQSDGSYLLRVNKSRHKYGTGKYNIHVYYQGQDGSMNFAGATTVDLLATRSHTIYIDPGHGGRDSGASYGGIHEKNLAISVANKLKDNLLQRGLNVLMTRSDDTYVDFRTERSRMANESDADLFISLHFNATGVWGANTTGIETYWYQYDPNYQPKINAAKHNDPTRLAESELLANKVQDNLIKETGAVNRGVKRETFAVLRETAIPAVLVEMGFMDNPSELNIIKEESYHVRLAKALAQGVLDWYGIVGGSSVVETSNLSSSQKSFVEIVAPTIQEIAKRNSLLPSVVLSQAILESSWGTSYLATQGNNLFGIKADNTWTGETIEILTNEFRNGEAKQEKQLFRKYNSWIDSISDYAKFFTSTPWRTRNYQVYRTATNYQEAILALQQSGYATDPKYSEKLRSMIERYHLNRLDK